VQKFTAHSPEDGLVPRDLIPYHYDLEITPNFYLDAPPFPFDGTVRISFECLVSTSVLTVNSYGLSITSVAVVVSPDSPTNPPTPIVFRWELDTSADFLHAYVTNPFEVGAKYVATISYTGIVNSYEYGLYWDSYVSSVDGKTK
jgi:Peptidase M1 N-terminal domain